MNAITELNFEDLTPNEAKVKFRGKVYTLREADAAAGRAYRNAGIRSARMEDGKVVGVEGAADVEMLLVSMCLFDEADKPVTIATMVKERWEDRVVQKCYDWIKQNSNLSAKKQEDESAKKSQEPMLVSFDSATS